MESTIAGVLLAPVASLPRSHREVIQYHASLYEKGIQNGDFEPFVYPWGALGALVVIVYLLIPHRNRPWLKNARFLAFAWITAFAAFTIRYTRPKSPTASFGLGLISAWSVLWVGAILVVNDAQTDFQRIERTGGVFRQGKKEKEDLDGTTVADFKNEDNISLDGRNLNGHTEPQGHLGPSDRHGEFAWQPFPLTPFVERLDWVLDIFCNFRGVGWNWRTSSLAPPPKWVQEQLRRNTSNPPKNSSRVHPGQTKVYPTRRELLIANTKTLLIGYIQLDALITLRNHDPYFWGLVDQPPPAYFPAIVTGNPVVLNMYRLAVSQFAIKWALETIFCMGPLFFSGLIGPSILGARAEAWVYPETWGSYDIVLDRGLAGWWSGWWHQTFRFAFDQPSKKLIEITGMNPKSPAVKGLQLVIAFGLSGFLHACGSYTCHGITRPLMGPIRFFLLQAVAVFAEVLLSQAARHTGIQNYVPKWAMRTFTFTYVHFWFYHTAPLLCEDFAKGGVWLFEPIPISLFRGLGFGVEGDGWCCWSTGFIRWYTGKHWWKGGIAF
ncbi:hypothetical protein K504DRAFT_478416 [Pleomassaria siparia CBS 279.74]|uniref:Wax synthase domain-containing protein n=1 Tax=Pleomassaria siparia CBS 279.74 TaxID=1314801 RepID=A0A6G1KQS5_9PLEO|nr:hypothetical protein K504DRAFT_478416 [Pleomassaria siparia CBS 279.74]